MLSFWHVCFQGRGARAVFQLYPENGAQVLEIS